MIDHFEIKVKNLEASKLFYQKTLAPLGYKIAFEIPQAVSFAEPRTAAAGDFWLGQGESDPTHFAFNAETREQVDAFYQAGLVGAVKIMVLQAFVPNITSLIMQLLS
ncbi:hypothetical protein D8790_04220 [Streptococcus cristatus]|uniref:Glyoxalase/fosfomycin resistance/dioxygenase domain-containing protein n=1 Tax=Streptococcus cristatus TaxID=45634 RepID=A0A3R9N3F7_STRCR|nr:hypothetical protein D8790_04220 [Streptococcus cristatus]